jgi:hypothetical protein
MVRSIQRFDGGKALARASFGGDKSSAIQFDSAIAIMNLFTTIILCNCTIASLVFVATIWTIQLRRQVVALTDWFDRWNGECDKLLSIDPLRGSVQPLGTKIADSRANIVYLRQLYRQQLQTVDRLRSLITVVSVARSLLMRRR